MQKRERKCAWHIPALAISNAEMLIYFSNEICDNKFIKQHQETAMVLNYQKLIAV